MSRAENLAKMLERKAAEYARIKVPAVFVPGCTGKMRHPRKEGAINGKRRFKDPSLSVYHCNNCGGWHIGHRR